MTSRVPIVDIAKGLCIVLVVFSHSVLGKSLPELNHALGLFRMPLFFFLSGIFLKESASLKQVVLARSDALLKPYFVTLLALVLLGDWSGEKHAFSTIKGILYGNASTIWWGHLWFLTHLWLLHLVALVIAKYTRLLKLPGWLLLGCLLVQMPLGAALVEFFRQHRVSVAGAHILGLPFNADLLFLTLGYFLAGRYFRDAVASFKPRPTLLLAAIASFVVIAAFTRASLDLNNRVCDESALALVAAIAGGYLVLALAGLIGTLPRLSAALQHLGRASLFLLVFHWVFDRQSYIALTGAQVFQSNLIAAAFSFAVCIAACLACRWLVVRNGLLSALFLPFKSHRWRRPAALG